MAVSNKTLKILLIIVAFTSVALPLNADAGLVGDSSQNIPVNNSLQNIPANCSSVNTSSISINSISQNTTIPDPWGFGYFIHPSVIWNRTPVFGHNYWMSVTPYPYVDQPSSENQSMETPCLYYSDDGLTFEDPQGIKNPIAGVNPVGYDKNAYGSDPEIVYNPDTKQMFCYYVIGDIVGNVTIEDPKVQIYNGREISKEYNCNGTHGVSPSVIYDQKSKKFYMWIVDIDPQPDQLVRYESTDGINFTNKKIMDISKLYMTPWHTDVCYNQYDKLYYMIIKFSESDDLWLATSNNVTGQFTLWQSTPTIYCENVSSSTNKISSIYRSSGFFKDESNVLDLWLSVQNDSDGLWHIIHTAARKRNCIWEYSQN